MQKRGALVEAEASMICLKLFQGVQFLHQNGICHRDLKPENIIFTNRSKTDIKIIDFGLSKMSLDGMTTRIGTPYYVSPEVLKGEHPYSYKCDMWSLGVIVFFMLFGYPPFCSHHEA